MCLRIDKNGALVLAICIVAIALSRFPAFASSAPAIHSIAPSSGTSRGGTKIKIRGANFASGAEVTIGGLPLAKVKVYEDSIEGIVPAHVAGGADVVVTNPDGQKVLVRPFLHNQGFEAGNAQWSSRGSGSAVVVNDVVNAHNGTYYTELSSRGGEEPRFFAEEGGNSGYIRVTPGEVVTFGGWAYRVSGNGRARWSLEVSDDHKRNPLYVSAHPGNVGIEQWESQESQYIVPAGKAFIRIYCEITLSTVASVARFDDAILQIARGGAQGYFYTSPPILASIAPNWGTPAGGTTRTIFGTGFGDGDQVFIGEARATNVIVNNANAITFFVPPNAAGTVDVTVSTPEGESSSLAGAYSYKTPPAPPAGMTKIHHIIYQLQENRSFDDYFGVMNQYRAKHGLRDNAVEGLNLNQALPDISGRMIKPFHQQTGCTENTQPSWNASHVDYNNGAMDGFMKTGNFFGQSSIIDPNGTRAMGYYDWTDVPYYYAMAFNFGLSDHSFASIIGPTGPNRAYSFAATSLGYVSSPKSPEGGFRNFTIFDLLDQAGISWKYYYQNWNPTWIPEWSVFYKDRNKIVPLHPTYYEDLKDDSTFPEVVFIEENGDKDEHPKPDPGGAGSPQNIQDGPELISHILGALMNSPAWKSSAYILTWDEAGGTHDHVAPPNLPKPDGFPPRIHPTRDQPGTFNRAGFRVPLIVVSPWTGPHFVSHTVRDHTSILKLIETRFRLPPLTGRDAAADDMREFFNFSNPSWTNPPSMPTQPTNGPCDLNLEKAPGS